MADDKNLLTAGWATLERGMASGADPRLIGANQAARLINATVRGGFPHPRPGWVQRALTYADAPQATIIEAGRFQGSAHFTPNGGIPALYASFNGRQFKINVWSGYDVQEVSTYRNNDPSDLETNPASLLQVWWCDTGDFLLMQDGSSRPWVTDGGRSWRLTHGQLPVGCMMEYALGRIWVVLPDRQSFVAGDLSGSSSGTPLYNYKDAVLYMTENDLLITGGSFSVPASAGLINAVRYMPNLDTSLGQGPVQFFVTNGAFSVNAPFDRTTWKTVNYPIQTVSLGAPGALAQNSTVRVNSDIWYRALDGVRSFIVARRDFTMWGNVSMSEEMDKVVAYDTPWLLPYSSAVLFDNRLLMTANPRWKQGRGIPHDSLLVMDFDLISSLGARSQPCWDGAWTGRSILQLVTGEYKQQTRCWAWVFNNVEGNIELWELLSSSTVDQPATLPAERIKWGGESRLFDYGLPKNLKTLEGANLEPANIQGTVDFTFKYRSDDAACWQPWTSFQLCATQAVCPPTGCLSLSQYRKAYRSLVTLPEPSSLTCSAGAGSRPANLGIRNQIRWEITGYCELKQLVLQSRLQQQAPFEGCSPASATCTEETCCAEDNNFLSTP